MLGLNHDTAPISVREKLSFDLANIISVLRGLIDSAPVEEAVILSTCNRAEVYFCADSEKNVLEWIARDRNLDNFQIESHFYRYEGLAALRHLSRVVSGLNSMVLGETQIVGQCRQAFRYAKEAKVVGPYLHRFFDTAFSIAKDVRTYTEVGEHSVSLASAALRASSRIFDNLSSKSVLFVGAGEMIRLCSEHFSNRKFRKLAYTNRSFVNAKKLADKYGGESFDLELLGHRLHEFDIVLSCTGSVVPIIGKGVVESALRLRKHRPVAMFDFAVPRDIEDLTGDLDDVFLFSLDDLGELVRAGTRRRSDAVESAESLIDSRLSEFDSWIEARKSLLVLKAFRENGDRIVDQELLKAVANLNRNADPQQLLFSLANAIKNKFLDAPSRTLANSSGGETEMLAAALIKLFKLEGKDG